MSLVTGGLDDPSFDGEGRLIIADYRTFVLYTAYYPNGGDDLSRVPFKLAFSEAVLQHAGAERRAGRSGVLCGDFNTAHREIDLANPRSNQKNTGFLPVERAWFDRLLDHRYVDVCRVRHRGVAGHYTWWSARFGVRERNVGWRIDYFFVSPDLVSRVVDARHHPEVMGSDHSPIELVLEI